MKSAPALPKIEPVPATASPMQPGGSLQPLAMNFNIARPLRPMPVLTQRKAGRRSLIGAAQ